LLRRKVEKKVEIGREEVRRGKGREEGKSSRRKLFIACVSLYWCTYYRCLRARLSPTMCPRSYVARRGIEEGIGAAEHRTLKDIRRYKLAIKRAIFQYM